MTHSETIAALAAALAEAQGELAPVAFDRDNPFYHSRYATLTALREGMRPVFARHGLAVVQGLGANGGITTTILHASGEWIALDGPAMCPVKADPQGIGSAMTYARRYGLAAAAGLVADEDDDAEGATHGKAPQSPQDASAPRSGVRPPEAPTPVNAEGSDVNAGASRVKDGPVHMTAIIATEPRVKHIDKLDQDVVEFDADEKLADGQISAMRVKVTAWHQGRDFMLSPDAPGIGAYVDITGRWKEYRGSWSIDTNDICDGIPF